MFVSFTRAIRKIRHLGHDHEAEPHGDENVETADKNTEAVEGILDVEQEGATMLPETVDAPKDNIEVVTNNVGAGFANVFNGIGENLASGNFWSSIIFAFPLYLTAIIMGLVSGIILGGMTKGWTMKHAMGGSLYALSYFLITLILAISFMLIGENLFGEVIAIIIICAFLIIIPVMISIMYFSFGNYHTDVADEKIVYMAIMMPLVLITGLVAIMALAA